MFDDHIDWKLLAPLGELPGAHIARFQRENAGIGAGRVERLARPGQFDLLEPVCDQDRDLFSIKRFIAHSSRPRSGCHPFPRWRGRMARAFRRLRSQRLRPPDVARGLEVARRAAGGLRPLRETAAIAVVGARPASAAFFPAEADGAEQIERRYGSQGAERPRLLTV